ncbi:E3 ubiquitin ligase complex SCF subunit sconB [Lecanosticta acicola]|uniref:E3 ubiquitin ligase complex SCF subunit sconB n=1 Tax=Lecanosticta acicola TaxID=111012 RepID=A0AAI8YZA8_9PEZI|nr:E3 ubiquitin ligase complex SCF subunit sconB [Lecanosticta acicola]
MASQAQQEPTPDAEHCSSAHPDGYGHELYRHDHDHHHGLRGDYSRKEGGDDENKIAMQASAKHAEETLAPFLSEHIPTQYNPTGAESRTQQDDREEPNANTKFCYRHRPDLKCRRQANEPSMEQLQNELGTLSQSDQQAISHVWSLFSAAPAKHRNLMLQGILTQCCFPQLSFISANIRDLIKIDFLSALPAELGFKILCYLDTVSLCKAAQVSQRWRRLADDDVVWHKMCEQHIDRKCTKCGWGLPLLERKRLRAEKRQVQLRATGRGLNEWSPAITPVPEEPSVVAESSKQGAAPDAASLKRALEEGSCSPEAKKVCMASPPKARSRSEASEAPQKRPWKDVYKDRFKVGTAWKYGRCTTKVFKGHTNGVMCLQFTDNVLITGSYDTTVKVWDINTGECVRTMNGHTMGIRCLQFDSSGQLMTGGLNGEMYLWNWKTGQRLRSFPQHGDGILSLHYTTRYVASGSRDSTVRVFDMGSSVDKRTQRNFSRSFVLRGHRDWVNCVRIDEASRTLFSASDDCTIKLWDLDTGECIRTFEGHVGQVQQVVLMPIEFELDGHRSSTGERDDDASSVSSVTIAASHQDISRHHEESTSSPQQGESFWPNDPERPAPPRYMLTGALDCHIRLWDTHFRPPPARHPTPQSHDEFEILPTDPLTNSHFPRAQACIRTFFGHVEGIWALSADHLRLVSGGEDRMMKVWDPRTGKCERTFTGHQGPVTCSWLSDSRVASGSEDCEVRMLCFGDE